MVRRLTLLCIGALVAVAPLLRAQASSSCLAYEPAVVTLRGRLVSRVYPGPPNLESTKAGDEPEHVLILALPRSVCVHGDSAAQLNTETERGLREMQLVIDQDSLWAAVRRLGRRSVLVTGTLFHAGTAHHHTRVLITVTKLEAA